MEIDPNLAYDHIQTPSFSYDERNFQELFNGLEDNLSKKQKDMIVYHFVNFIAKDIQKQLNRMVKMYKRFKEDY